MTEIRRKKQIYRIRFEEANMLIQFRLNSLILCVAYAREMHQNRLCINNMHENKQPTTSDDDRNGRGESSDLSSGLPAWLLLWLLLEHVDWNEWYWNGKWSTGELCIGFTNTHTHVIRMHVEYIRPIPVVTRAFSIPIKCFEIYYRLKSINQSIQIDRKASKTISKLIQMHWPFQWQPQHSNDFQKKSENSVRCERQQPFSE